MPGHHEVLIVERDVEIGLIHAGDLDLDDNVGCCLVHIGGRPPDATFTHHIEVVLGKLAVSSRVQRGIRRVRRTRAQISWSHLSEPLTSAQGSQIRPHSTIFR